MIRMTLAALLTFMTAFASEAHARTIDEVGWVYDRALNNKPETARRKVAAVYTTETTYFSGGSGAATKVQYQCGGDTGFPNLCLMRIIDPANRIVCYGADNDSSRGSTQISCVPMSK